MENTTGDGAKSVGFDWVWLELRDPIGGDQLPHGIAHPSAKREPYTPDGWTNPPEVTFLWVPYVVSISAKVKNADFEVSTTPTDEILADFIPLAEWQDRRDPSKPANYTALRELDCKQPVAGYRTGQVGGRLVYATNAGRGYRMPAQANINRNSCMAKHFRVFPLVLSHSIELDHSGCWIIETEWRLEQV